MPDKGLLNDLSHKIMVRLGELSKELCDLEDPTSAIEQQLFLEWEFLRDILYNDISKITTVIDEYSIEFDKIIADLKDKKGIS